MEREAAASQAIEAKPESTTARMVAWSIVSGWHSPETAAVIDAILPPDTKRLTGDVLRHYATRSPIWTKLCETVILLAYGCMAVACAVLQVLGLMRKDAPVIPAAIHTAFRKRIIYDEVVDAIEKGLARQVVVLGGGYDVLCMQLSRTYPNVLFVEVDQPNTQLGKRVAAGHIYGTNPPRNHRFAGVDFRFQTVEQVLATTVPEWKNDVKSVAVAEGVWPYLTPDVIRESLRSFRRISAIGSVYVFNYYVDESRQVPRPIVKAIQFLIGTFAKEPFRYLPETADEVGRLVSGEGFDVDLSATRTDCYQRYIVGSKFEPIVPDSTSYFSKFIGIAVSK
ncbi:Leucine carboxyl methyltransferase [Plasmodiophora brassicae]|uniref:Uncharacterized protein n=1 Tax=Plasmodiophora brassicae TaxID=37360 RepID=A0A0G4IWJ1_PLABS|nr:hypothetical protein PBRA_007416 [Plasmodiophora brassicae]